MTKTSNPETFTELISESVDFDKFLVGKILEMDFVDGKELYLISEVSHNQTDVKSHITFCNVKMYNLTKNTPFSNVYADKELEYLCKHGIIPGFPYRLL